MPAPPPLMIDQLLLLLSFLRACFFCHFNSDDELDLGNEHDYGKFLSECAKIYGGVYSLVKDGGYIVIIIQNLYTDTGAVNLDCGLTLAIHNDSAGTMEFEVRLGVGATASLVLIE